MRPLLSRLFLSLTLIFSIAIGYPHHNEANRYELHHIEGIPNSEINDIHEDRNGFIWIATLDGLYRYDGYNYKAYDVGVANTSSRSNMIFEINEDSHGNIWVSTYGRGLGMIDTQTDIVTSYNIDELLGEDVGANDIVSISIDKSDNIWAASMRAVIKFEISKSDHSITKAKLYPFNQQGKSRHNQIKKIHIDQNNNIWIGCNLNLRRVTGEHGDKLLYETYDVSVRDIDDYGQGSIVVLSDKITIVSYDKESNECDISPIFKLKKLSNRITTVSQDQLWIGGNRGFANICRGESGEWYIAAQYDSKNLPFEMTTSLVSSILYSSQGVMWFATRGGGIITATHKIKFFQNYPHQLNLNHKFDKFFVKALFEDADENLWIGTETNGVVFQPKGKRYGDKISFHTINNIDNRAYAFEQMPSGVMLVGTSYYKNLVALKKGTFEAVEQSFDTNTIGFVFALKMSDETTLWAGTYNAGLWRLRLSESGVILGAQNFNVENSSLGSNIIRSLFIDDIGDMWIGTDVGINRLERADFQSETPKFLKSPRAGSKIASIDQYTLQITQTKGGDILFGTMGKGVGIYHPTTDSLRYITTKDGLANNSVKSIVECKEEEESVWLSTNRGLSVVNLKTGDITNYNSDDGIEDCEFSEISALRRKSGEFVYGNREGLVTFRPEEITPSLITPELFFTDLYINYRLIEVGEEHSGRVILEKSLEHTSRLDLEYSERNFSIGFVGLNFGVTQGCRYKYKLEGVDKQWVHINSGELVAKYTNINDGKYLFRVVGANHDGVWSDSELQLHISIEPPLYRSAMAYILYVFFMILILYFIFWIVTLVISKRNEVFVAQMERHKAEEMSQHKEEFFMNVSHDFRTPLTLINIMVDRLMAKCSQDEQSEELADLRGVKHNANTLMSLINKLLDFRRIEQDKGEIRGECVDLGEYLRIYFETFKPLAEHKNIQYIYESGEEPIRSSIDKEMMEKVVVNLLSNAFKYIGSGDRITLSLRREKQQAMISVRDNGRGVAKEEIEHLFDRFYQGSNRTYLANANKGSGIGLSLCKKIVDIHSGTISVISDINQGFEALVALPISSCAESVALSAERTISEDGISTVRDMLYDYESLSTTSASEESRPTLLIVEDNEELRLQLAESLQGEYNVITIEDGIRGEEMCRRHSPDLVITDIKMPKMNGVEMCRRIKACEEISHTPILVLSGDASIKNQVDSFTIGGADGYLEKPFNIELFRGKIRTILSNREILKRRFNQEAIVNPKSIARSPADLKYISQVIAIIKKNLDNPELNIEFIAGEYGVSRTYLNRKIKAITGITSTQFLRNIRMKYAAKLIMQKSMNITEIAWAVGYNDVNTFRSRFKDMYGVLPTAYNGESAIVEVSKVEDELLS